MNDNFDSLPVITIQNASLRLDCLSQGGPRLVRCFVSGSNTNLLAELPQFHVDTSLGTFHFYGGHRLWHAPEEMPRTYIPDDRGGSYEALENGLRLSGSLETPTGIRKVIEVRLHKDRPELTLRHELHNEGLWSIELAPWAITMLPLGGLAVFPQPVGALNGTNMLPNRNLVTWPYSSWQDPRLRLADDLIAIEGLPRLPALKIGYFNRSGCMAYYRQGVLFCKLFQPAPGQPHVDFGCNTECYCNDRFIELESLGPLQRLEPGKSLAHLETWQIYSGLDQPQTVAGMRELVNTLLLNTQASQE